MHTECAVRSDRKRARPRPPDVAAEDEKNRHAPPPVESRKMMRRCPRCRVSARWRQSERGRSHGITVSGSISQLTRGLKRSSLHFSTGHVYFGVQNGSRAGMNSIADAWQEGLVQAALFHAGLFRRDVTRRMSAFPFPAVRHRAHIPTVSHSRDSPAMRTCTSSRRSSSICIEEEAAPGTIPTRFTLSPGSSITRTARGPSRAFRNERRGRPEGFRVSRTGQDCLHRRRTASRVSPPAACSTGSGFI